MPRQISANFENVHYRPVSFEKQLTEFDLITMLFPFMLLDDCLKWCLPRRRFAVWHLLANAWESLRAGGCLLIVNRGHREHQAQSDLFSAAGIKPLSAYRHESLLFEYDLPRFVIVATRV